MSKREKAERAAMFLAAGMLGLAGLAVAILIALMVTL